MCLCVLVRALREYTNTRTQILQTALTNNPIEGLNYFVAPLEAASGNS